MPNSLEEQTATSNVTCTADIGSECGGGGGDDEPSNDCHDDDAAPTERGAVAGNGEDR